MTIIDFVHYSLAFVALIPIFIALFCWRSIKLRKSILASNIQFKNASPNAVIIFDKNGGIVDFNEKALILFEYTHEEMKKLHVESLIPQNFRDSHRELRKQYTENPVERPHGIGRDLSILTKNGKIIPAEISLGTIHHDNRVFIMVGITDITERKKNEEIIYKLAYYDPLTELPNRSNFNHHAEIVLRRAKKAKSSFAFFLVDLDGFKKINDTMGHSIGDEVLHEIAERLKEIVDLRCEKEEDCHCFVARLGGDEFVVVFENLNHPKQIETLAEDIYDSFTETITVSEKEIFPKLSMGVSVFPHDGFDVSSMLKAADLALYEAKNNGKNQYVTHTPSMNSKIEDQVRYERIVRDMIEKDSFKLAFQPIYDVVHNRICGAEVLLRSSEKNFDPETAIDTAEELDLIAPLSRKLMERAFELHSQHNLSDREICLSVNISMKDLMKDSFVRDVLKVMHKTQILPSDVSVEVTETIFVRSHLLSFEKLLELRKHGVHVSIDDFGKGYSSMSQLRHLPFDKLKVDKEFVDHLFSDDKSKEIVKGITHMAHALNLQVCVEGVETKQQFDLLKKFDVDMVQGYYTGKPVPIETFLSLLEEK